MGEGISMTLRWREWSIYWKFMIVFWFILIVFNLGTRQWMLAFAEFVTAVLCAVIANQQVIIKELVETNYDLRRGRGLL